jgi:hypothetical protein
MNTTSLLAHLRNDGLRLNLDLDGGLRVWPSSAISDDHRKLIRDRKSDLATLLEAPAEKWWLYFEESEPQLQIFSPGIRYFEVLHRCQEALFAEAVIEHATVSPLTRFMSLVDECVDAGLYEPSDRIGLRNKFDTEPISASMSVEALQMRIGRCNRCRYVKRPGLSGLYCSNRTDLPHAYGLLFELPKDQGALCTSFLEAS